MERLTDISGALFTALYMIAIFIWPILFIPPFAFVLYSSIFVWQYDTPGMRDLGNCALGITGTRRNGK